jgi:hypothetical protein
LIDHHASSFYGCLIIIDERQKPFFLALRGGSSEIYVIRVGLKGKSMGANT